jgi:hypothetical protein
MASDSLAGHPERRQFHIFIEKRVFGALPNALEFPEEIQL